MQNFPSNLTWIPVANCSCPIAENNCYRPELYSKPIICAHNSIPNILNFLQQPGEFNCSFYFVYFILFAILGLQLCLFGSWLVERYHNGRRMEQQQKRRREERIFAPDLRVHTRRVRQPIKKEDIGPPLPLHCLVTKQRVDVHEIEMDTMGGKENLKKNENIEVENKKVKKV
ncbi:unnamed protein product [Meloidogyne enterolobii]|uniref:Uncharacterized protein n=2 Tax=Meloidogyne enterolobii TaxID=390850 RepID=A0ACB0Z5K4_MELEN